MTFSETIFLFFLALVIFGPKKLPEIARQVGKVLNEFRRASNEFKAQIEQEIAHLEVEERRKTILPPEQPVEGTASRTLNAAPTEPGSSASTDTTSAQETQAAGGNSAEPLASPEPATLAASATEPAPAEAHADPAKIESPTSDVPVTEAVAISNSQESHA